jgi:hypothetical protein
MKEGLIKKNEVNVGEIWEQVAKACWYSERGKKVHIVVSENFKMIFEGTVYENGYESYTASADVYIEVNGKKEAIRTIDSHCVAAYKVEVEEKGSFEAVKKLFDNIEEEYVNVLVVE